MIVHFSFLSFPGAFLWCDGSTRGSIELFDAFALEEETDTPPSHHNVILAIVIGFGQLTSNMLAAAFCCLKLISSGFYQACEDRIYLAGDRHLILAVL